MHSRSPDHHSFTFRGGLATLLIPSPATPGKCAHKSLIPSTPIPSYLRCNAHERKRSSRSQPNRQRPRYQRPQTKQPITEQYIIHEDYFGHQWLLLLQLEQRSFSKCYIILSSTQRNHAKGCPTTLTFSLVKSLSLNQFPPKSTEKCLQVHSS